MSPFVVTRLSGTTVPSGMRARLVATLAATAGALGPSTGWRCAARPAASVVPSSSAFGVKFCAAVVKLSLRWYHTSAARKNFFPSAPL